MNNTLCINRVCIESREFKIGVIEKYFMIDILSIDT